MNRVAVIGPPGAGKTEFAAELGKVLRIDNVVHLDHYLWKPGWKRTTLEERLSIIKNLTNHPTWIVEGNYLDIIDQQLSDADLVIWLNVSLWTSFYRVITRYITRLWTEGPANTPGITPSFLWSIFLYRHIDAEVIRSRIENHGKLSVVILNSTKQAACYLKKLQHKI